MPSLRIQSYHERNPGPGRLIKSHNYLLLGIFVHKNEAIQGWYALLRRLGESTVTGFDFSGSVAFIASSVPSPRFLYRGR